MSNINLYIFLVLSIITIVSALCVIFTHNPIYSLLFLIITFFSISGHYILLNAQFLAIVNLIVYSGAIMVLFLFVLMLMNLSKDSEPQKKIMVKVTAVIIAGIFLVIFTALLSKSEFNKNQVSLYDGDIGLVKNLGTQLFQKFVLPFELTGLLFLSAIMGTVILARNR